MKFISYFKLVWLVSSNLKHTRFESIETFDQLLIVHITRNILEDFTAVFHTHCKDRLYIHVEQKSLEWLLGALFSKTNRAFSTYSKADHGRSLYWIIFKYDEKHHYHFFKDVPDCTWIWNLILESESKICFGLKQLSSTCKILICVLRKLLLVSKSHCHQVYPLL